MSKVVFSLFVALSLFAFVSVNSEYYTIPSIPIDLKTIDFSFYLSGMFYDVGNFTLPTQQLPMMRVASDITKIKNYFMYTAETNDEPISSVEFPFGRYLYRDDLKKLVFYPPVGTGSQGTIHRCEDKGTSSLEQVLGNLVRYIDIAYSVRNKANLFTEKEMFYYEGSAFYNYTYNETVTLTDVPGYDSATTKYEYFIDPTTQLCVGYKATYTRHSTLYDYDMPYALDFFSVSDIDESPIVTEEQLLTSNLMLGAYSQFEYCLAEMFTCPNVDSHDEDDEVLVCPEIDLLPRPLLLDFLTSTNFTEYELVLDNPVSIQNLMSDTIKILNLTNTYPERVGFDGINKIGNKWSVNLVLPTDLGETLAVAVDNGDIKKSELPTVSKVKKVVKKASK